MGIGFSLELVLFWIKWLGLWKGKGYKTFNSDVYHIVNVATSYVVSWMPLSSNLLFLVWVGGVRDTGRPARIGLPVYLVFLPVVKNYLHFIRPGPNLPASLKASKWRRDHTPKKMLLTVAICYVILSNEWKSRRWHCLKKIIIKVIWKINDFHITL